MRQAEIDLLKKENDEFIESITDKDKLDERFSKISCFRMIEVLKSTYKCLGFSLIKMIAK